MEGWIKLHKQIQECILWSDKPFSKGQAWIDLLMLANFKDGDVLSKGSVVHIKRGQVFRTQQYLGDRWGWSIKKVRNFLKFLEGQEMVTLKGIAQGMLITIEKYAFYQSEGQSEGIKEDIVEGRQRATKEEEKEEKNIKRFIPPTVEEVAVYCQARRNNIEPEAFIDYYASKGWMVGKNKMKDWRAAVRNWERRQKAEEPQVEKYHFD